MNREHLKAWIEGFSSKIFFGILGNVCIEILFCRPNFCPVKRAWQACSQSNLIVQSRSSSGQGSYWKIQFTKPKRQTYTEFNSQISDARNKSREQKKTFGRFESVRLHQKATKAAKRFISAFKFDLDCYCILDSLQASSLSAWRCGCTLYITKMSASIRIRCSKCVQIGVSLCVCLKLDRWIFVRDHANQEPH